MASTGTKTTIKLATLTAAAKDDVFSGTEDTIAGTNLAVLANDPGSANLYSVWQPTAEAAGTTPATSSQLPIETSATLPSGAIITMNEDGTVNYNAGDVFQHLGEGDTATDTFSYTVRMANGALSTASVTVTIQGVNDAATISGVNAGTVTEDGALSASGSLSVSDVDDGEAGFQSVDENALTGAYGSFTFDNGTWTFEGDNAAAQHLGAGDSATQTLTVTSIDGTATETITVTIEGVNDAATISGDNASTVTEDGTLSASGSLSVSDADDDEAGFQSVDENALTGAYGSFTFDNGAWTFEGDNAAAQHLGAGDSDTQTLTVTSIDGTATETITVTIQGVNDPAAISGNAAGAVTEDGTLSASGSLLVSDVDDGEASFQSVSGDDLAGTYGDFKFDTSTGAWGYSLRNGDSNVQGLNTGDVVYDTLTVKSLDGSADQEIVVAINGANDVVPLIDFEDIAPGIYGTFEIPDGYHGFNWDVPYGINLYALDGTGSGWGGYALAGTNVAYTPWAYQPVTITRTDGGDFDFEGVELTSAWDSSQTVTLEGWLDGNLIYSDTVTIYNTSVTDVNEDWGAIDTLIIGNSGSHLVLDNFDLIML
ncbi:MAG: VCBS domain-containing protein [Pseudomonadota bacterium]